MPVGQAIVTLLAEQCPQLDLAGTDTALVQAGYPRTEATIVYRPNRAEFERRLAAGLGGITDLGRLNLLMGLPAGLPVTPDRADLRSLRRLPQGCVDITADGFVRQLTKPLDVKVAIATRTRYSSGLMQAGRFGAYCTRVLALTGKPRKLTEKAIEADFWGIGLIVNADTNPELVVAPTFFEPFRHTPAAWAFAEAIYGQIAMRTSGSVGLPASTSADGPASHA
jgi:hypothetical protein